MGASETINIPVEPAVRFQDAILEGFQAAIDKEENCDLQVGLISMILGICNSLRGSIFTVNDKKIGGEGLRILERRQPRATTTSHPV